MKKQNWRKEDEEVRLPILSDTNERSHWRRRVKDYFQQKHVNLFKLSDKHDSANAV